STTGVDAIGISRLRPSTPRSVDVCEATSITSASAATFRVCCVSSRRRSGRGTSGCAVAANANVLTGRGLRISSDRCLSPAHGSRSGSGVGSHKSHQRKSRMVEISLSGSGEGPGWVTSRPTLQTGLLFVGDCKMSAWDTRAYLARHQDWYLSPLPLTGATAEAMDTWITEGVTRRETGEFARIMRTNDRGHQGLAAAGYEFERTCEAPDEAGDATIWRERVLVMRSPMHADQQAVGLEKRLCHAETKLAALTPPRGRGKRQMTDEATLLAAIDLVLKEHRVEGW